jgi:hypothetical protein
MAQGGEVHSIGDSGGSLIAIKGQSAERFILKEKENLEGELKDLEEDLKGVEFEIDHWKDYVLSAGVIRDSFRYFSRIFHQLSPQEKRSLIRLLVKEIIFSNEEVVINLFEVPEEELRLESIQKVGFDQPFKWLPGQDSNLQHLGYSNSKISFGTGLSHHPPGMSGAHRALLVGDPQPLVSARSCLPTTPFSRLRSRLPCPSTSLRVLGFPEFTRFSILIFIRTLRFGVNFPVAIGTKKDALF